ncbi:hypothetical protein LLG95_06775 [bacterium]|nr:hypothetical protein [bacterium]
MSDNEQFDRWVKGIFDQPIHDYAGDIYDDNELIRDLHASDLVVLDFIDDVLIHPERLAPYSSDQIGQGFDYFFCPSVSDIPHAYLNKEIPLLRRKAAVENLRFLYSNYFERLCSSWIMEVGGGKGQIAEICYMLWDVFTVCPDHCEEEIVEAGINVMREALYSENLSCVVSALHGLGHWKIFGARGITKMIFDWLCARPDLPEFVVDYAQNAMHGHVQ